MLPKGKKLPREENLEDLMVFPETRQIKSLLNIIKSRSTKLNYHEKNILVTLQILTIFFRHSMANFIVYKDIIVGVLWVWNNHLIQLTIYINLIFYFKVIFERMLERIQKSCTALVSKCVTNIFIQKQVKLVKGALSALRQFLATESPLKVMKKVFCFTLKALFVLKIFKFLS